MAELLRRFRPYFVYAGAFSLAINLLLVVPPLYMLQVFDRVLASRSQETLLNFTPAAPSLTAGILPGCRLKSCPG